MSANLGPDLWNNAPDGSSPVSDIQPWLVTMRDAAESWSNGVEANADKWDSKISTLVNQIDGFSSVIGDDVFLSKPARSTYDGLCNSYQSLKDELTLSQDFYLTKWQQHLNDPGGAGDSLDKLIAQLLALLRQLFGGIGIVLGGAIVILLAYLYITRRK